jgi:hypothetical protein
VTAIGPERKPEDWRLLFDSLKLSLKAALLHNGNDLPAIPAGHDVHTEESHGDKENLLSCRQYSKHRWKSVEM